MEIASWKKKINIKHLNEKNVGAIKCNNLNLHRDIPIPFAVDRRCSECILHTKIENKHIHNKKIISLIICKKCY